MNPLDRTLPEAERLSRKMEFRVTPKDKEIIQKTAKILDMSVSEMIRMFLLDKLSEIENVWEMR